MRRSFIPVSHPLMRNVEHLKKTWHSPVYGFFKSKVEIGHENGRKYHYFKCAAKRCKGKRGIRHYQDSQDRAATSNLKTHTIKCFGADAVDATFKKGPPAAPGASIFTSFARLGQRAATISHRAHTSDETRYVSITL